MGKSTRRIGFVLLTVIVCALLIKGCGEAFDPPDAEQTAIISGIVVNQTGQPVEGALVEVVSPPANQQSAVTDSTGFYNFTIKLESAAKLTIKASKQNYDPATETIAVSKGKDFTNVELILSSTNDDEGAIGGEPTGAAAIVLVNTPIQAINIAETGGLVSAPFTFAVQDSAGRAVGEAVEVEFSILTGPGGGESLVPASATTNEQGEVTTTLFSGNKAGPVKIQALIHRQDIGLTVRSTPVLIAIHGGFPDKNHFSISAEKRNFEGYTIDGRKNTITIVLGDKFSNPVKPGTVVYFKTSGGIIQGSATTNENGIASVELISGNPRPTGGLATVTATTINASGNRISTTVDVVMSGSKAFISTNPGSGFTVSNGGGITVDYTVKDLNGRPMAAGTKIKVEAGSGIELTGDVNFKLGNFRQAGPSATEFTFSASDADPKNSNPAKVTIKISVTTPSGNVTTHSISGTVN